jgi:AcrR family transcriptional regulator
VVSKTLGARARSDEHKQERREAILAAALAIFEARGLGFTMADVAADVGLAKGTLYLYFATREALLLEVLSGELNAWFDGVDEALGERRKLSPRTAAKLLRQSLEGRTTLVRLLAVLATVLEHNIDERAAVAFKTSIAIRTAKTGGLLEERLPGLALGEGMRTLLRLHALIVGLFPMSEPSPLMRSILERPQFALLRIDFLAELEAAAAALLRGTIES